VEAQSLVLWAWEMESPCHWCLFLCRRRLCWYFLLSWPSPRFIIISLSLSCPSISLSTFLAVYLFASCLVWHSDMMSLSYSLVPSMALLGVLGISWLFYLIGLAIYRLYLSPIAKFPGPKLAALSRWYEIYYEVILRGQFTFHIQELHKRYGW
jgi:hypothetical protein